MSSVNRVVLIGRVGRDPEVRYTKSGTAVCNFPIATTDKWKDKTTGKPAEKTEWHQIAAWDKVGEKCGEYIKKGDLLYIEGQIKYNEGEKDGVKVTYTQISVLNWKNLSPKRKPESVEGGEMSEDDEDPIPF